MSKKNEIKGYQYADGVHWYWGDKEVAVINEKRREIEWCDRLYNFPEEVVKSIREKMPKENGKWLIEARRTRGSATQGNISIFVNGKDMDMHFDDKYEFINGEYVSTTPDEELGKFVYACLWHPMDYVYHYSDRFKKLFKPTYDEKNVGKLKKYYFTFGSNMDFPYQNTYVIVLARNESEAIGKFRTKYPDRHENTVNCSFIYSEEEWNNMYNSAPAEIIE